VKYLVVLLWPAGIVVIFGVALWLVRRDPRNVAATVAAGGPQPHAQAENHGVPTAGFFESQWVTRAAEVLILIAIGAAVVFGVMALLGLLVVHHGLVIDRPIYNWMIQHRVHSWGAVMKRLTKIGDTWTTWGAACAAAVCLAVTWRTKRWLPPVVFAAAIVVDHFTTLALRHTFHRLGPPDSPLGTYPSGGCDRVVFFYGLIAYLLWRAFSGRRTTAIWAGAAVAALGFNEAYSRIYLTLHWFTDALSGLLYGGLLLVVFITAIRMVAGPAGVGEGDGGERQVAAPMWWRRTAVTTGPSGPAS
jgi:membrane-associated phospholipid phosphatase